MQALTARAWGTILLVALGGCDAKVVYVDSGRKPDGPPAPALDGAAPPALAGSCKFVQTAPAAVCLYCPEDPPERPRYCLDFVDLGTKYTCADGAGGEDARCVVCNDEAAMPRMCKACGTSTTVTATNCPYATTTIEGRK